MDHVGVVVDDLEAAVAFFVELGMERQGTGVGSVDGRWVDQVVGLEGVRVDIVFVRTPDGMGRLELTKFHAPEAVEAGSTAPNTVGLRRLMFVVDDIDEVVARMLAHGAELIGEVAQYEDVYRLGYLRGPGGIIIALAEELRS